MSERVRQGTDIESGAAYSIVPASDYDALVAERDRLAKELEAAKQERDNLAKRCRGDMSDMLTEVNRLRAQLAAAQADLEAAQAARDSAKQNWKECEAEIKSLAARLDKAQAEAERREEAALEWMANWASDRTLNRASFEHGVKLYRASRATPEHKPWYWWGNDRDVMPSEFEMTQQCTCERRLGHAQDTGQRRRKGPCERTIDYRGGSQAASYVEDQRVRQRRVLPHAPSRFSRRENSGRRSTDTR